MAASIRVVADAARLERVIADLSAFADHYSELDADLAAELRQLLVDVALDSLHLCRVDSNRAAGGTGDALVALEASERVLELLAALRARHGDLLAVERNGHGLSLRGG